jgi:hypothetical protein
MKADYDAQTERLNKNLDSFLQTALTLYDVMKAVPHPYNAVADMANIWAHDFVGFAQAQQKVNAELVARVHELEAERWRKTA